MPPFQVPQINQGYVTSTGFSVYEAFPRIVVAAGAALTSNQEYIYKLRFPKADRITAIQIYVTAQSGNVNVGIRDCAATGLHDTSSSLRLLASSGSTAVGAANAVQQISLSSALNVIPSKDYWLTLIPDNAVVALGRMPGIAAFMTYDLRTAQKAVGSYTLADPQTTWGSGSLTPWIAAVGS